MDTRNVIDIIDSHSYTEEDDLMFEKQLQENGYPVSLIAIDGGEQLRARHIFSGINFFSDFRNSGKSDLEYLDMACQCAFYDALVKRTKINSTNIQNPDTPEDIRTASLVQLSEDCERLGKLYWSVGYIHASRIYLDIGNYYSNSDLEGAGALAKFFHEEAARNYYRASLLLNLDESIEMIKIIFKDEGLAACGWDDPDKAKSELLANIDGARNKSLIKEVQDEMAELLKRGNKTLPRNFNR